MISKIKTWAAFVRFSHTIFALPFALGGDVCGGAGKSRLARWGASSD